MQRQAGIHRDQRKQHGADPVDVRERIERQPAQHPRRRIAEPVRRPGVRRLVKRERQNQDDEQRKEWTSAASDKRKQTIIIFVQLDRIREVRITASAVFAPTTDFELRAAGAPDAGDRSERRQQLLAPAWPDAGDVVELRPQVAASRATGDGTSSQTGAPRRECAGSAASAADSRGSARPSTAVAREQQLLLLGDADRDSRSQPDFAQRGVRRRQLALAAVDEDQIRKRPARSSSRR